MSDSKISALTALTGANVDTAADVLAIVDTSVTTTKKILIDEVRIALGIATAAETLTGTSAVKFLTPSGFAGNKDIVGNDGYYKFPGGLIIQWDDQTTDANGDLTWTYPTAFSTQAFIVIGISRQGDLNRMVNVGSATTTSCPVYTTVGTSGAGVANSVKLLAIGV